jgi:membrane protein implicated in regulation of membrane protease activity
MEGKAYTIYSIITTLLEEAGLAAVVLWLLPRFGIDVPPWGLTLMMAALGIYSYITYRLGKQALNKRPVITPDMAGSQGKMVTPLAPQGYVRVGGELWQASTEGSVLGEGEEVVVEGMKGLVLIVNPILR